MSCRPLAKAFVFFMLVIGMRGAYASVRQQSDSLGRVLKAGNADTTNVRILLKLSQVWRDSSVFQSLNYAAEANRLSEKAGWAEGQILATEEKGACYDAIKEWSTALKYYNKSKELAKRVHQYHEIANACLRISETYNLAGKADSSLYYKLQTLEVAQAHNDTHIEAQMLTFLGGYYMGIKQYDKSLIYWKAAHDVMAKSSRGAGEAITLNNLGDLYIATNRHDSALCVLRQALRIVEKWPQPYVEACIMASFGDYFKAKGNYDSAIFYAAAAVTAASSPSVDKSVKEQAVLQLSTLYDTAGRHAEALAAYKKYMAIRLENEKNERLEEDAKAMMKYEYDLKTAGRESEYKALNYRSTVQQKALIGAAISILFFGALAAIYYYSLTQNKKKAATITAQAEQLKKQKQTIQQSLTEKEVLLKEIHHRVKNNLQVISALLQLQGKRSADAQVKEALQESQNRVLSIAFIHQNLYQHDNLDRVEIAQFVAEQVRYIHSIYNAPGQEITIKQDIPADILELEVAVPLALIINELLSNSYKYAFHDRMHGHAIISISRNSDDTFRFVYTDDGPGLPAGIRNTGQTLGLTLIEDLCRQIGGRPVYYNENGFKMSFEFATNRGDKAVG